MGAAITGWGIALPERTLSNAELSARLDVSERWIRERTGIEMRHIASDADSSATLAADAGARALARAGVDAEDLDVVIVATSTPDHQIPATAPLVQHALGAGRAGAFDVNAACSGFLYALAQADALIATGVARRALVCGSDVLSRVTDYSEASSSVLFGDGGGAVLVDRIEGPSRLGPFVLRSDGADPSLLCIPKGERYLRMQGREVYRRAVEAMTASVRDVLDDAGMRIDEIDLVVAHQANARIVEAVGQRLGLRSDQVALNIARLGNTSAASIPLALAEASSDGRLNDGDIVVLTAFGAGFVWGAGMVRWGALTGHARAPALVGETHV